MRIDMRREAVQLQNPQEVALCFRGLMNAYTRVFLTYEGGCLEHFLRLEWLQASWY